MDWWVVFEIVVGTLISISFVIWMENIRKPKLILRIEDPPVVANYTNRPAQTARYLRLIVANKELPSFAKWLSRSAALRCRGSITFYHLDGQNVFGRSMQARWAGSPEPLPIQAFAPGPVQIQIFDPARLIPELHRDIRIGAPETMDVAVRFDTDVQCYGWCNDNYFSNLRWRNPDWRLDKGRYLVKVEVVSDGEQGVGLFRLINDVSVNAFRLENALPDDYAKISTTSK